MDEVDPVLSDIERHISVFASRRSKSFSIFREIWRPASQIAAARPSSIMPDIFYSYIFRYIVFSLSHSACLYRRLSFLYALYSTYTTQHYSGHRTRIPLSVEDLRLLLELHKELVQNEAVDGLSMIKEMWTDSAFEFTAHISYPLWPDSCVQYSKTVSSIASFSQLKELSSEYLQCRDEIRSRNAPPSVDYDYEADVTRLAEEAVREKNGVGFSAGGSRGNKRSRSLQKDRMNSEHSSSHPLISALQSDDEEEEEDAAYDRLADVVDLPTEKRQRR